MPLFDEHSSTSLYQGEKQPVILIVSRPDEMNCNIHETLAFNPPSATGVFNVIIDILIVIFWSINVNL